MQQEKSAASLCALAEAKLAKGETGEAIDAAAEAVAVAQHKKQPQLEAEAWNVLATATKDVDAAQRAVDAAEKISDKRIKAGAYMAQAQALAAKSKLTESLDAFGKAEACYSEAKDDDGVVKCKIAMAKVKEVADPAPPKPTKAPVSSGAFFARPVMGSAQTQTCSGLVAVVTGASRGIGKGIAEELARSGAIVYVTGRSTAGASTDALLGGTVDETAQQLTKAGGTGVAVHMDHSFDAENKALATLLSENNMRVDTLVNNAFYIPKPDQLFFGTPVWKQPLRYLDEQWAVGGFCHMVAVVYLVDCLRRGRGLVVNISSWGSHQNIPVFPVSYLLNKAAFDQSQSALAAHLQRYHICIITLYPGSVRSERSIVASRRSGFSLSDAEGTRFTGRAVVALTKASPTILQRLARRTLLSADVSEMDGFPDVDGYMHEPSQMTYQALK